MAMTKHLTYERTCASCVVRINIGEPVQSHHCAHVLCTTCARTLIYQSLVLLNEIPRCVHPGCDKPLGPLMMTNATYQIHSLLPPRYRPSLIAEIKCQDDGKLLCGFIRLHYIQASQTPKMVPAEITSLIQDFYDLTLLSELPCTACDARGFVLRLSSCTACSGTGTQSRRYCKRLLRCILCNGSGTLQNSAQCVCRWNDVLADTRCMVCAGSGFRQAAGGRRGQCSACYGVGVVRGQCKRCQNGLCAKTLVCSRCCGIGHYWDTVPVLGAPNKLSKVFDDEEVVGDETQVPCIACDGRVPTKCATCANGVVHYAEFGRIVQKQLLCRSCNLFWPMDQINHWSGCRHTFCLACYHSLVRRMNHGEIPVCAVSDCHCELESNELLCDAKSSSCQVAQLERLKFRKDRFECSLCGAWHLNTQCVLLSQCQHALSKECGSLYIQRRADLKQEAKCVQCRATMSDHDVENIAGRQYVHVKQYLRLMQSFSMLLSFNQLKWIAARDWDQVISLHKCGNSLVLRPYFDRNLVLETVVECLQSNEIEVRQVEYINVIVNQSNNFCPLFQIRFKNAQITAKFLYALREQSHHANQWMAGFWEIRNQHHNNRHMQSGTPFMPWGSRNEYR